MQTDPQKLLEKYKAGQCSDKEKALIESWYLELQPQNQEPSPADIKNTREEVWVALLAKSGKKATGTSGFMPVIKIVGWAAIMLLTVSLGYYFKDDLTPAQPGKTVQIQDVVPGGNKAFLTLADGRKISLTDAENGDLVKQEGLTIKKTADGELVYTVAETAGHGDVASLSSFNTIETPKGGKYQINLPDGTRVWLNSASSLRYPTRFKENSRIVELSGEAYFEVAKMMTKGNGSINKEKGTRMPFIVKSSRQEVEVLGTHFNINSYDDEAEVKTTLLEGKVKVVSDKNQGPGLPHEVILNPGEQSQLNSKVLNVKRVDAEAVLAWKNGDFLFEDEDLKSIMRKVSRWYDVEVIYKGSFENLRFGGLISRSKHISSVLGIMESTGRIHFVIEGKKVTVLHNNE